jgi:hypothetical protein
MLVLLLLTELLLHIFEDGWPEVIATFLALILSCYALIAGFRFARESFQWIASRLKKKGEPGKRANRLPARAMVGGLLWLLVVAPPPPLLLVSAGQFFYYGFHVLSLTSAIVIALYSQKSRAPDPSEA